MEDPVWRYPRVEGLMPRSDFGGGVVGHGDRVRYGEISELRCYVIFRFYLIFCILCMFRKLWLESFGTHLYTKHIKASHSITKLILQRPGLPFSRERRLQSQSKKSRQGLPFRALGFSTWILLWCFYVFFNDIFHCFPLFSRKRTRTIDRRIRIDQDWQQTAGLAASHSGSFWWYLVENGKIR